MRHPEGETRRTDLMPAVRTLRAAIGAHELRCLGEASAIVPVLVGHTALARLASRETLARGLFVNLVEFPAVGVRAARFRMRVQSDHTPGQALDAANILAESVALARELVQQRRRGSTLAQSAESYLVTPMITDPETDKA